MNEIEDSRDDFHSDDQEEDPRKLARRKAGNKPLNAKIEHITTTIAHCPKCDDEYDVDDFGSGDINCECGSTFHWCSEI